MKDSLIFNPAAVQTFDGVVPHELYRGLLTSSFQLNWQFRRAETGSPPNHHWHHAVDYGDEDMLGDAGAGTGRLAPPMLRLYMDWLQIQLLPPQMKMVSCHFSAQTFGMDGPVPAELGPGDGVTLMLQLASHWLPEWGGESVVSAYDGEIEATVTARPNRLLAFPSDKMYTRRPFNKIFDGVCVALVVKVAPLRNLTDAVLDPVEHENILFLTGLGSHQVAHSGRSLLTHLRGTYRLLRRREADPEVCLAGLFHSIYGTSIMHSRVASDRADIRARIGVRAERLAWLFCSLHRPACWSSGGTEWPLANGSFISISPQEALDLRMIERANLDEQGILAPSRVAGLG